MRTANTPSSLGPGASVPVFFKVQRIFFAFPAHLNSSYVEPIAYVILPRICGRVKSSDILFQKEDKGHAKSAKDLYGRVIPQEAVQLAQTSGKSIAQVARELGISDTSIHQWRKELTEHGPEAFPGSGHQTARSARKSVVSNAS